MQIQMRSLKNIMDITLQGFHRVKENKLVIAILIISASFLVMFMSYSSSIVKTNAQYRLNTYGEWDGAFTDAQGGDREFLETSNWIEKIGTSTVYGNVSNGSDAIGSVGGAIGTIDDDFIRIGRIETVSGRLPKKSGEIAMDESTLIYLGYSDAVIGQEVEVSIFYIADDGWPYTTSRSFTLCGITKGYANIWNVGIELVSAIITEDDAEELYKITGIATASLFFTVTGGQEDDMATDVAKYLSQSRVGMSDVSKQLYTNDLAHSDNGDSEYNIVFVVVVLVISFLAIVIVYALMMDPQIKRITRFRSIGATKSQVRLLVLFETALTCVPAILFGTLLGAFGVWLLLRLSVFVGSSAVFVDIPLRIIGTAVLLWAFSIFIIRLATIQIAISTPLTGKMSILPNKQRKMRLAQKALIIAVSVAFCGVVVFSSTSFSSNYAELDYYNGYYWYHIWEFLYNPEHVFSISDEMIAGCCSLDCVKEVIGFSFLPAFISSDELKKTSTYVNVVDVSEWERALGTSSEDVQALESDNCIVLTVPESEDLSTLPQAGDTVTLTVKCYSSEGVYVLNHDAVVEKVVVVDQSVEKYTYGLLLISESCGVPYGIVCSREFLADVLSEIPDGYYWSDDGTSAKGYLAKTKDISFAHALVFAERGADYTVLDSYFNELSESRIGTSLSQIYVNISREYTVALSQNYLQTVVLLLICGGCIGVVTLIILSSTIRLETQREKRRYGILQAIGMSRRQRNLRLAGTALIRAVIAVAAGWGVYILSLVYTNREAIKEGESALTVISDYMTNIAKYYMSPAAMGIMTAILFAVVFGICYASKLGLNRFSLMELLREEG